MSVSERERASERKKDDKKKKKLCNVHKENILKMNSKVGKYNLYINYNVRHKKRN